VAFALNGSSLGSWAPRIPALAEQVGASPGSLGFSLLGGSAGMVVAGSFSGRLVERAGIRTTIAVFTVLSALLLPALGLVGSVPLLGIVLFFLGMTIGLLNVAMNLAAVGIERRAGRPLMSTFHASASVGTLAASAAAALAAAHRIPPAQHFAMVSVVVIGALVVVLPRIPELGTTSSRPADDLPPSVAPIRRRMLWRLAGIALCAALVEGAGTDWSTLLMIDIHGVTEAHAVYAYTAFAVGILLARLSGAALQRRWGPSVLLTTGAVLAGSGAVAAALAGLPFAGYLGLALTGIGIAIAFPMALSLSGEQGRRADGEGGEREVAFVGTAGYAGFVVGPPVIGMIAEQSSLSVCFVLVGVVALIIAPLAGGITRHQARPVSGSSPKPAA
jgi:MFS family permease